VQVVPAAQRLVRRARLTPWRVELILEQTAAIRDELGRFREETDASAQVLADTIALLNRSLDDLAERLAAVEGHLGSAS